jgi:WD40 repeat protein
VWSLSPSVEPLHQVGRDHGDQGVRAVAWIPGKPLRVLAGGDGGWLEVSEAQGGGTRPLPPHKGDVTSVAVSSDGRLGATASRDGKVRLWDLASLEILDEQDLGPGDHANAVALTERGDLLIAGTQRGLVIAYHATAPTEASPGEKR